MIADQRHANTTSISAVRSLKLAVCAFTLLATTQPVVAREGFADQLKQVSKAKRYVAPTANELTRCEMLFRQTLRGPVDTTLIEDWKQLGFEIQETAPETIAISESVESLRGWGYYLIHRDRLPGVVLQAPHSFYDKYTRSLALRIESDGGIAVAAWNTIHRKKVDVAHDPGHPFTAFTRAVIQSYPQSYVVQLHGFSQNKRATPVGATADLIVSNGTRFPAPWVRQSAVQLRSTMPFAQVHLFPESINELGATTNVQADAMQHLRSNRFIHLEMSRALRLRLLSEPAVRLEFFKNLATTTDE